MFIEVNVKSNISTLFPIIYGLKIATFAAQLVIPSLGS